MGSMNFQQLHALLFKSQREESSCRTEHHTNTHNYVLGRMCRFTVVVTDRPGGMAEMLAIIAENGGSIKEVNI